jgi:hypothetical protein
MGTNNAANFLFGIHTLSDPDCPEFENLVE